MERDARGLEMNWIVASLIGADDFVASRVCDPDAALSTALSAPGPTLIDFVLATQQESESELCQYLESFR